MRLFEFLILVSQFIWAEVLGHVGRIGGGAGDDGGTANFAIEGDEAVDVEISGPA